MSDRMTDATGDSRSSAEIEREVERSRAQVETTLDELRERTTPGQLFEQALDYARRSGGPEFFRNLGEAVRDNPLPVLLIGSGIAWLMLSGGGRARAPAYGPAYGPVSDVPSAGPYPTATPGLRHGATAAAGPSVTGRASAAAGAAREGLSGAAHRAGEAVGMAGDAAQRASDAVRQISDAASDAVQRASDTAEAVAGSVSAAAASAGQQAREAGHYAREQAGHLAAGARQGFGWLLRDQPLILGALGVALGAAIGGLLPPTETEDRLMGETRDRLAERAREAAEEGYERAKETAGERLERARAAAGEAAEKVRDRLDQGGAAAGGAREAIGEAARELREAVRDTARDVAAEAREAMGGGERGRKEEPRREDRPAGAAETAKPGMGPAAGPVTGPGRPGPA